MLQNKNSTGSGSVGLMLGILCISSTAASLTLQNPCMHAAREHACMHHRSMHLRPCASADDCSAGAATACARSIIPGNKKKTNKQTKQEHLSRAWAASSQTWRALDIQQLRRACYEHEGHIHMHACLHLGSVCIARSSLKCMHIFLYIYILWECLFFLRACTSSASSPARCPLEVPWPRHANNILPHLLPTAAAPPATAPRLAAAAVARLLHCSAACCVVYNFFHLACMKVCVGMHAWATCMQ